ncbi:hypothetical protein [Snodgrassella alvi]|uniref:Uncharacterized protein n=1 Tax=Snodgrassella alvi TaxID=1196083 RepID=A0A2N9X691_9NEIS|nr:hypothetical protein [Snodgrassella alvi]PIT38694.1 hypothetical protein BHC54_09270 [Snodgrassella alvi]PIT40806.1 hypothetical protein BHC53_07065 [Snodgrassella alvi]
MARKTKDITIESGRDAGKSFRITEMPILQADKWAQRALFAIARAGVDTSSINMNGGMLEMARLALDVVGKIDPEVGGDLLDELLSCVQIIPTGGVPRSLVMDSDIEDIKTLFVLRKEVLALHIDFLKNGNSPDMS